MNATQTIPSERFLPKVTDRLPLGGSGLKVSPLCLGMTKPEVVLEAFEMGINFFFVSADLHWPLYEGLRVGLAKLLTAHKHIRDQIVIGVVSYLEDPLFRYLQFWEVISSIPGMDRVDLLIAGSVSDDESLSVRYAAMQAARVEARMGARAIGGSFHSRSSALASINANCMDIHYIRYNSGHPGARDDIFPHVRKDRSSLIFNFKSMLNAVPPERAAKLGLASGTWMPKPADYYRFVLSNPAMDGVLCAPQTVQELHELVEMLKGPALSPQDEEFMMWLSAVCSPEYF